MKKGFTLIELLAVVSIVAVLAIITLPTIINQYNEKANDISALTKKTILSAAELYASEHNINYGSITLEDLIKDEKLESPVKDQKTGKEIPLTTKINLDNNGNACFAKDSNCEYVENSGGLNT